MREAINNNPMVQLAVIGVLVLVVGLFMMMNLKKKSGSSSSGTPTDSSAVVTPSAGGTSASATPGVAPSSAPPSSAPSTSGTVTPDALIPGPGLPQPVVSAWKGGKAVVLLIVRPQGIDDKLVTVSTLALDGDPRVAVFLVPANKVARYSRITQGVGVDRVPALVVVRPRKESGSVPQATVSYGFRNSQSVVQAVHDAVYSGRDDLPYSPR
jgi:hypothetical protein